MEAVSVNCVEIKRKKLIFFKKDPILLIPPFKFCQPSYVWEIATKEQIKWRQETKIKLLGVLKKI